jgi:hypothetical protein
MCTCVFVEGEREREGGGGFRIVFVFHMKHGQGYIFMKLLFLNLSFCFKKYSDFQDLVFIV